MDNYKSIQTDRPSYRWEGDGFGSHFIGYAARDSFNTPHLTHPIDQKAVGESVNRNWRLDYESFTVDKDIVIPALVTYSVALPAAPAIPGENNTYEESYPTEIYPTAHRDLNYVNRIETLGFDAASLQFVTQYFKCALLPELAELFKAIDYSEVPNNLNNEALNKMKLVQALGYTDGLGEPGTGDFDALMYGPSKESLINYINEQIIGRMNGFYWCWDFFPDMYANAALLSRTWKEDKNEANDVTLITCKLDKVYEVGYEPQNTSFPGAVAGMWQMKLINKPTTLWDMAKHIKKQLEWVAADESFRNITTTMQTIMNKKGSEAQLDDGMTIKKGVWDFYPYHGRQLIVYYQPAMLIAFHNATVMPIELGDTHEVAWPSDPDMPNKMVQLIQFIRAKYTTTYEAECAFGYYSSGPVYDMPEMWETNDYEAVTAASYFKFAIQPGHAIDTSYLAISPKTMGSVIITKASIWRPRTSDDPIDRYNDWIADDYNGVLANEITNPGLLTTHDFYRKLCQVANISSFPLHPLFVYNESRDYKFCGWPTDLTKLSFFNFNGLQKVKEQLVRNGCAYPLIITGGVKDSFMGLDLIGKKIDASSGGTDTENNSNGGNTPSSSGDKKHTSKKKFGSKKDSDNVVEEGATD